MAQAKRSPVAKHRQRQRAKGLVRVEVEASGPDAPLLREVAAVLRSGERRASALRSLLRKSLRPAEGFLDLLALDLPDAVVDAALARPRALPRRVKL
jgi:hypothetical protein